MPLDFWRSAIRQQFHAAIDMLANAIGACPTLSVPVRARSIWYLAFHALFFLDLYLSRKANPVQPPPPFGLTRTRG